MGLAAAFIAVSAVHLLLLTKCYNSAEIFDKHTKNDYFDSVEYLKHPEPTTEVTEETMTTEELSNTTLGLGNQTDDDDNDAVTKPCKQCQGQWQHDRDVRLEMIKVRILANLGMDKPPNITKPLPEIPEPLQRLIDRGRFGEFQRDSPYIVDEFPSTRTEKIITFATNIPIKPGKPESTKDRHSYIRFSPHTGNTKVLDARLYVYIRAQEAVQDTATWLHIYELGPPGGKHSPKLVSARKIQLSSRTGHWEHFEFKRVVHGWISDDDTNWGLNISATDHNGNSVVVTEASGVPEDERHIPYLELRTHSRSIRKKRSALLQCAEQDAEERCCRYPLVVDFEEFQWDFIIAPKTYEAFYCAGECPNLYLNQYPHTHLVEQINPKGSAGPCCTSSQMSPMTMLYFNDVLDIVYGVIPAMVVESCGCS